MARVAGGRTPAYGQPPEARTLSHRLRTVRHDVRQQVREPRNGRSTPQLTGASSLSEVPNHRTANPPRRWQESPEQDAAIQRPTRRVRVAVGQQVPRCAQDDGAGRRVEPNRLPPCLLKTE